MVEPRTVPSRCGAQCKTWARGPMQDLSAGPSEQWCYDDIVFSQPCYDHRRVQICSTALTRELSTFANSRGNLLVLTRAFFVINEIYMAFVLNSQAQGVSGKMNILPKHHGAGPPEARGPMQLHRLHRLKAGPGGAGSGAWNLSSCSTDVVSGASQLHT